MIGISYLVLGSDVRWLRCLVIAEERDVRRGAVRLNAALSGDG